MIVAAVIISILVMLLIAMSFALLNLLRKNEKCEDIIKSYENHITNLSNTIKFSDQKLKEVDSRGLFTSDDEVGFFFQQLKYLQEQLNNFKVN